MRSSERKVIFSGFFWKFSERICAQFVSFVVSIVLARMLAPSEYGVVALLLVFINIANVFVTSGFSAALIQKRDANEEDFSTIFYCTVIVSILIYLFLFWLSPFIAQFYKIPELCSYFRIFSLKIIISSYNSIQHAFISKHMLFKKFFFSTLIGAFVSGIIGILLAYFDFGAWALIAQYLTSSFIDTVVLHFIVPWRPRKLFSVIAAKSLLRFGWKVLATDLLGTLFDNLRSLLIGKFYTSSDLAFYNKGHQFPSLVGNNIDITLSSVLFPAMSNVNDDLQKVKEMTRRAIKTSSFIIFPLMAILIGVAEPLVILLLTDKWLGCVSFLQILCVSQAVSTLSRTNLQALKAIGRSDVTLKLEFIKKPLYLTILLISLNYGVLAIAISMMIYSFLATALNMWPNKELLNYSIVEQIKDVFPAFILASITGFVILPFTRLELEPFFTLLTQSVVGIILYIVLSFLFKVESLTYLRSILKSFKRG